MLDQGYCHRGEQSLEEAWSRHASGCISFWALLTKIHKAITQSSFFIFKILFYVLYFFFIKIEWLLHTIWFLIWFVDEYVQRWRLYFILFQYQNKKQYSQMKGNFDLLYAMFFCGVLKIEMAYMGSFSLILGQY